MGMAKAVESFELPPVVKLCHRASAWPRPITLVRGSSGASPLSWANAERVADLVVRTSDEGELRRFLWSVGSLDGNASLVNCLARALYWGLVSVEQPEAQQSADPPLDPVWEEIESILVKLFSLPHNKKSLADRKGQTPAAAAAEKLEEIRSGILGTPVKETLAGPKLLLRVVGPANRAYSGEWWFDAAVLENLETNYARLYFTAPERKGVIRDMLRDVLAVSNEWNSMMEIWALAVPAGETIVGYSGAGARQPLFQNLKLTDKANRMLVGGAKQYFFPVKNPLWVQIHSHLSL